MKLQQLRARRRRVLECLGVGVAAGIPLTGFAPKLAWAESASKGAKVMFILYKRADLSDQQSLAEWNGEKHTSIVRRIPGLKRWVQNRAVGPRSEGMPVGIGELWFDNAEAMNRAMKSPEMAAAGEDAKRFLDMAKTYAVVVEEETVIP